MGIEKGELLNHNKILEGREEIERVYVKPVIYWLCLLILNLSEDGILKIKINEGYINDIIIKGNEKTKDFVILRNWNLLQETF